VRRHRARAGRTTILSVLATLGLTAALTMPVLAEHDVEGPAVQPTEIDFPGGPPVCEGGVRFGNGEGEPALEQGSSAGGVTITEIDIDAGTLSFETDAGVLVSAVYMKGGNSQNLYDYSGFPGGGVAHDDGLVTPDNASGGPAGISHVDFCLTEGGGEEELSASLTIAKSADGDEGETFAIGDFDLADGQSGTITYETEDFTEGEVIAIVTETLTEAQEDGLWVLESIDCDAEATFEVDLDTGTVTVTLHDGDDVTCTFVNTQGDEGTQGGNPPPPGSGTAGGNPPPNTAMEAPGSASAPAALLAIVFLSILGVASFAAHAEARRRR
jgi:hypothetical protein